MSIDTALIGISIDIYQSAYETDNTFIEKTNKQTNKNPMYSICTIKKVK